MKLPPIPLARNASQSAPSARGMPLLRLGFRPFYLCAALFAALAVPLWVAVFFGQVAFEPSAPAILWHAHEMLFGFATTVIIGFLLTAVKAWTGLDTLRGPALGALVLLWLAARITAVTGPYAVYAVLDLALLPLVAAALIDVLVRARNTRNLPLAMMLILMALANLAFHLAVMGVLAIS
ncbi:MAG: NnrS family protein, partial [Gammaproteobacteria bacterium]